MYYLRAQYFFLVVFTFDHFLFHSKKEDVTPFYHMISSFIQRLTHSQQICTFVRSNLVYQCNCYHIKPAYRSFMALYTLLITAYTFVYNSIFSRILCDTSVVLFLYPIPGDPKGFYCFNSFSFVLNAIQLDSHCI